MRVQALHLQQDGADHLRAFRHHDPHAVLYRGGVGGAVGEAADAAHAVREERDFVVAHAGFRQLFHAAVDVEQAVVGVDNVFAVNEQAEVARLVRGDVQRADRHHVILLAAQLVDELVGFAVGSRRRALAVVHAVFAQRIEFVRPVVRQHQTALVRQANRHQAIHVAHFALAPDGGGHARRDGRVFRFIRVDLDAHGDPALLALLHRHHVVHRVTAAQLALVVTEQHRQPAALPVVEKLHHFRQIVHLNGDGDLVFGLPGLLQHHARESLMQRGEILLTFLFFRHKYSL